LTVGRFITLEGGEGVGKSTLGAALKFRLEQHGFDVVMTREPGGTPGAMHIRTTALLTDSDVFAWPPLAEALLFFAARTDHLEKVIRPALARGAWVICDRFSDSTRAYQAAAGGALSDAIEQLDAMCVGATQPDLTLVLDLPLSQSSRRRNARPETRDVIEERGADYHERVRQAFIDIARKHPQRCAILDASAAANDVADAAMAVIDARLGMR
jgi:dTMP kinase